MKAKKLPSGNYRVQIQIGHDENGKRIMKSFTAPREWEALKMADDYLNSHNINTFSDKMTVYDAISQYIESRSNILSPSTIRGYRIILKTRLQQIMDVNIKKLNVMDIQAAINFDSARLSRKSIKSAVALLKSALAAQDIEFNLKKVTLPQARKKNINLPNAEYVIKIIIGSEVELPCLLAMWLSLRISEVRGLQFRDISSDGKSISVCRVRMFLDKDVLREQTKTEDSTRTNKLPPYLLNLIKKVPHESDTDFIVPHKYEYIRSRFEKLMIANGYNITFHKLRHEFATTLNDLGIPSDYIQKLGGWSTDNVMKSVYTHTTDHKKIEYQDRIDDFFNSAIDKCRNDNNDDNVEKIA